MRKICQLAAGQNIFIEIGRPADGDVEFVGQDIDWLASIAIRVREFGAGVQKSGLVWNGRCCFSIGQIGIPPRTSGIEADR